MIENEIAGVVAARDQKWAYLNERCRAFPLAENRLTAWFFSLE